MRTAIYIIAFIILSVGIAFTIRTTDMENVLDKKKDKKEKKKDKEASSGSPDIRILEKHEVPAILREISAIVYLDENRFACVQDELGTIFIYNTETQKFEKEIEFAGPGDYEGLAIVNETAYVLRSDGEIAEVRNYSSDKITTVMHKTHLTADHNTEGLCYDSSNNRLLIAIKGTELNSTDYKGIYSFNLAEKKMQKEPVYKIDLSHSALAGFKSKKKGSQMQPSAIAIHPKTKDIYIADAASPKLLILNSNGNIKAVKTLSSKDFYKPEGISFSPDGKLFISNEGKKEPGNILQLAGLNAG